MTKLLRITTKQLKEIVDVTELLQATIRNANMKEGLCSVFVTHTTAAVTTGEIGEGTEQDFLQIVEEVIPRIQFRHAHDPSHAWSHMAASPRPRSGRWGA